MKPAHLDLGKTKAEMCWICFFPAHLCLQNIDTNTSLGGMEGDQGMEGGKGMTNDTGYVINLMIDDLWYDE